MKYYTVKEVAEMLKINESTIRGWFMKGKMKKTKVGSHTRISEEDLQKFLKGE